MNEEARQKSMPAVQIIDSGEIQALHGRPTNAKREQGTARAGQKCPAAVQKDSLVEPLSRMPLLWAAKEAPSRAQF